ncbi:MAG: YvcK family protein [Ardenticatenaceae bacterium]|nr:YvcK family protein [Ardenticatenaceae bacterium]
MRKKGAFFIGRLPNSRWLTPGMGVKRWLLLLGFGALIAGMGFVYVVLVLHRYNVLPKAAYDALTLQFLPVTWRIVLPLVAGGGIILLAVYGLGHTLLAPFRRPDEAVSESLYHYSRQGRGPLIVAIGGGTGMPALLRGLREYTRNITAVVTVADDGGSSGRLRRDLGLLPPGDFRNNIAALSRDEALMTQVLQYRFGGKVVGGETPEEGDEGNGRSELQGHAFGNLLLAALTGITGSFDEALLAAERVLALRGRVLPSTLEPVTLAADVAIDGQTRHIVGESAITEAGGQIQHLCLEPSAARAYPPVLKAILQADLIVMGPGSLYTSILPNLLIADLATALQHARAPKVYICNLAIQPGETDNYTVADHVKAILQHLPTNFLDIVLANDNLSVPPQTGGGHTLYVQPDAPDGVRMITADLVDEKRPWRHDSEKVARAVIDLLP